MVGVKELNFGIPCGLATVFPMSLRAHSLSSMYTSLSNLFRLLTSSLIFVRDRVRNDKSVL